MNATSREALSHCDVVQRIDGDALAVTGLTVAYRMRGRNEKVLHDVTFRVRRGEAYGLVGESGCGKSTIALAALSYLPSNGKIMAGHIAIAGTDTATLDAKALRLMRATTVSMVYQDPSRALNPLMTIGLQLSEAFGAARGRVGFAYRAAGAEAREQAIEMLHRVRIAAPQEVMERYPHQLSGGMQQRVVIAMALASNPALLILDEPTTALDATVEAEVLDLIAQLREEFEVALLFISHNVGIIRRNCDRVGVLYSGRLVEEGASEDVLDAPCHPYTAALISCEPRAGRSKNNERLQTIDGNLPPSDDALLHGCVYAPRCPLADEHCRHHAPPPYQLTAAHGARMSRCHHYGHVQTSAPYKDAPRGPGPVATPMQRHVLPPEEEPPRLRAQHLSKTYTGSGYAVRALDDVSLTIAAGETLGLVGESGSGKTTLAKLICGLVPPDPGGLIELDGTTLSPRVNQRNHQQVKSLQVVFQNPDSALNRAHSVKRLIGRALSKLDALQGAARTARLTALVDAVRLPQHYLPMRARQLSGGLKQRVAIARAFAGEPRIVICDEPTSSLDASVQAAILNLLVDLQRTRGTSYLFISHNLEVVRYISDRIAVLYAGRLMEIGAVEEVFDGPHHPYTAALLSAIPTPDTGDALRQRIRLSGDRGDSTEPCSGCAFQARCPMKIGTICEERDPSFVDAGHGHLIRCHIPVSQLPVRTRGT
jgi:peptide/nickel transport system ATP-binding protein